MSLLNSYFQIVVQWFLTSKYRRIPAELAVFAICLLLSLFVIEKGHALAAIIISIVGIIVIVLIYFGAFHWVLFLIPIGLSGSVQPPPMLPPFQTAMTYPKVDTAVQNSEAGVDEFKARIWDPRQVELNIHELKRVYTDSRSDAPPKIVRELIELEVFLKQLFMEVVKVLSDPAQLAPIVAEVGVVVPGTSLGIILIKLMIKRIKGRGARKKNRFLDQLTDDFETLFDFFSRVPKSRITEIAEGTQLPKEHLSAVLKIGPFDHESGCFWKLVPEVPDVK